MPHRHEVTCWFMTWTVWRFNMKSCRNWNSCLKTSKQLQKLQLLTFSSSAESILLPDIFNDQHSNFFSKPQRHVENMLHTQPWKDYTVSLDGKLFALAVLPLLVIQSLLSVFLIRTDKGSFGLVTEPDTGLDSLFFCSWFWSQSHFRASDIRLNVYLSCSLQETQSEFLFW